MGKDVTLGAIFPEKYSNIIYRYVEMVNDIIKEYDAVIFMARKSICFYDSLIIQGEIEKADNCCIMSSRALEYNVLERFRNKRIAIVDDVVVKGISITKAIENLKVYGIKPDIYIAACEKDFIDNAFGDYKDYIKMPYIILNQIDICEFATYITKYIETSGCPYNIDQPIYKIFFEKVQDIEKFFEDNNYVDITSKSQKEFGIISRVIHFESQFLSEVLPKELDLNDVYIKIRVIHIEGSLELIMLPFILLPSISYDLLNNLYSLIQCIELDQIIEKNNERSMYENKLNIFQYVFSNILIIKYLKNMNRIVSKKVYSNEIAQFSKCLLNKDKLLLLTDDLFKDKSFVLLQKNVYKDIFLLNDYLSKAYDLVLTKNFPKVFENSQGSMIQSKVITITLLEQYIRQQCSKFDPYTLSNLIDIFIDRGIFVPTVVHYQENKGIVRAYKGGEVAKITALEMELFVYMLAGYLDNIDRDYLDKTEFEKLCVLFFRCAITKSIFPNISNNKAKVNDEDAYEISYAKFGPRVSVAEGEKYEAGEKHLLVDELIDLELLGKCKRQNAQGELKEKYYVKDCQKVFDNRRWEMLADLASVDLSQLYRAFQLASKRRTNQMEKILYYIPTYNRLLTLASIGENKKERVLSLAAEVYLFASIHMENLPLKRILSKVKSKFDGICSGIWKYACYRQDMLLFNTFTLVSKDNYNIQRAYFDYVSVDLDLNPNIDQFIQEIGEYLVSVAYSFYKIGLQYKMNMNDNCSDFKYVYCDSNKEIINKLNTLFDEKMPEEDIIEGIYQLQKEGISILDRCDIFISEEVLSYKNCKSIFVIYSETEALPDNLKKQMINCKGGNCDKYKYLNILCKDDLDVCTQLENIINSCENMVDVKILFCEMAAAEDGIYYGRKVAVGKNFNKFIESIISAECNQPKEHGMEFLHFYKGASTYMFDMYNYELYEKKREENSFKPYIVKRYWIEKKRKFKTGGCEMKIEKMEAKRDIIIKEIHGNNLDVNIEIAMDESLLQELKLLKEKVKPEQAIIIDETMNAIENKNESKIKDGLLKIVEFGKGVLSEVASATIIAYMTKMGMLPPV